MSKHLQIHVYEGMIEIKKFNFGKKDEKLSNWEDSVKLDSQQNLKEQMKQMNNENKNRNKNENNKFESKNQNKLDNRNENTKFDNRNESRQNNLKDKNKDKTIRIIKTIRTRILNSRLFENGHSKWPFS